LGLARERPAGDLRGVDEQLERARAHVSAEEWERRIAEADRQAAVLERVLELVRGGMSERAAMSTAGPDAPRSTWLRRLERYRAAGRDGLISRRYLVRPEGRITPDVVGLVRGLVRGLGGARSPVVRRELEAMTGETWSAATVKRLMVQAGVAQRPGRPAEREQVEAHALAGAELLLAVDQELGATAYLAKELRETLKKLPEPSGEVRDDSANRDPEGRFLPAYNAPEARTEPELGAKFDSVEVRRKGKNLPAMRVANTSVGVLWRKVLSMVVLPILTDSPRWEALRHWQGDHLEDLVGIGYRPATLDKFVRELKYADVVENLQYAVAEFWLAQPGMAGEGLIKGAAVAYVDTSTKSVWTHHFTRCVRVSNRGRVMPGVSTMYLHTGPGTPVLFQSYSGHVSIPAEVLTLLRDYEALAGEDTVRRVVVIDREGHSVALMKALAAAGWQFIIPLRKSVTGPNATFSDRTEWAPYQDDGDQVRGSKLLLRDESDPGHPLLVRVVERKRHRTQKKIEHYATTTDPEEVPDALVLEAYFERWPLQEHRFRDGSGRVHLDTQHGYGKLKVDNVAVIDRREKLLGQIRRHGIEIERQEESAQETREDLAVLQAVLATAAPQIEDERRKLDEDVMAGHAMNAALRKRYRSATLWEPWLEQKRHEEALAERRIAEAERKRLAAVDLRARKEADVERLDAKRQIFTVDVVLDQILTAFKLTFMNLAAVFLATYLQGPRLQLDTLIRGILTLPGERVRTSTTETIRIYRHDRDTELMPRVAEACRLLTAKRLVRGKRTLAFELVDPPRRGGATRAAAADTA
jgi:hypothetical protein